MFDGTFSFPLLRRSGDAVLTGRKTAPSPWWRDGLMAGLALGLMVSLLGLGVPGVPGSASTGPDVRISELTNGGPGGNTDHFIEIANFGDATADLDGWRIYSCSERGRRGNNPARVLVPPLSGVTLAPGETYMIAREGSTAAAVADALYDDSQLHPSAQMGDDGAGAWLEDDQRQLIDRVGIYAPRRESECGDGLPNDLDYRRGQSYQRTGTSGDVTADFIKAGRTPNAPNATVPDSSVQATDVLVSELTNGGPDGSTDNFIELGNFGEAPVDVSGWRVYRCTATGRRMTDTLQATLPDGTILAPGAVFVVAHASVTLPAGVDTVRYDESLSNDGFGALIEDTDGNVLDAVGVYEPGTESTCTQGGALPNRLDFGFDETYQRFQNSGDNAADFVKADRRVGELVIHDSSDFPEPDPFEFGAVRVSEIANSGPYGAIDNFFELANYGDEDVSLEDWTIHRCREDGRRAIDPQLPPLGHVTLAPGETFLAVREGSPLHKDGQYDAVYGVSFNDFAFGLIVFDAEGRTVDSVGVYGLPHPGGDAAVEDRYRRRHSPCTKGVSVMRTAETEAGDSYQRFQATGDDVADFVSAPRTPGRLSEDLRGPADIPAEALQPVDVAPNPRPVPPTLGSPASGATDVDADVDLRVTAGHATGEDVEVTFRGAAQLPVEERAVRAFTGVSNEAPPTRRRPPGEESVPKDQLPLGSGVNPVVVDAEQGFPYQRYELTVRQELHDVDSFEITWSGRSVGRNEVQLYVWNHRAQTWDLIDAGGGVTGGEITLIGAVDVASHVRGRRLDVLVQDGPATKEAFSDEADEPNLAFKHPDEYDFAFGFMTDTQFWAEGYRAVYADMVRWLVTNQNARDIAYTFHTGDITQNWAVRAHLEPRARDEFKFASDVMRILEDAGHPHGVTPGNHDNHWGWNIGNDLFNEFFPPSRYAGLPWYGGSWREDDNQNHYDVIEIGGAKFLMVYLGMGMGSMYDPFADEVFAWANQVIADHPQHNVILATHEYMNPAGRLTSPERMFPQASGERYWNEVVLPNDNVFLALAGHVNGVVYNVKRDVNGVEGRTVVEMVANYQDFRKGGRHNVGFLRLLQVDVDSKSMAINSYSPTLDEHNAWEYDAAGRYDDSDDEFLITDIGINDIYTKRVETDLLGLQVAAQTIGTHKVGDGDAATVTWSALQPDTTYAWYAEARDASGATVRSPVWLFTTRS